VKYKNNGNWNKCKDIISLHDAIISGLDIHENSLEIRFCDGFTIVDSNSAKWTNESAVLVKPCVTSDITCRIVKRIASPIGELSFGKPIDLYSISKRMKQNKLKIQIEEELYGYHHIYLRGTVEPCKRYGLADYIIIEIADNFTLEYFWN